MNNNEYLELEQRLRQLDHRNAQKIYQLEQELHWYRNALAEKIDF